MSTQRRTARFLAALMGAWFTCAASGQLLLKEPPAELDGVAVEERLGSRVPGDIALFDAQGQAITIGQYFADPTVGGDDRPIVLMMVYYDCPLLCGLVMERAHELFNKLGYQIGEDFKVLVVSFDHTNTPAMAAGQQTSFRARYVHADKIRRDAEAQAAFEESYNFHTASAAESRRLADSIGFKYKFLPQTGEFSHPAVLCILTPDGIVSRYLDALETNPQSLRMSLLEASDGAIGSSIGDFFLHTCYVWDPTAGVYNLEAMRAMQVAGVATVVGLTGFVGLLFVTDQIRKRRRAAGQTR